jgi:AcrR family transcriptional regulator
MDMPTSEPDVAPGTRERLIVAAIELFALQGISDVSLRAVAKLADARNTAAVHYHFGDRESLLVATLGFVLAAARERVSFDEARKFGFAFDFADDDPDRAFKIAVAKAFLPVMTLPDRRPWGHHGVKLLSRVILGEAQELAPLLNALSLARVEALTELVQQFVPHVPRHILHGRIEFALVNILCGLASLPYLRQIASVGDVTEPSRGLLAVMIVDYIVAGLSAVPATTIRNQYMSV